MSMTAPTNTVTTQTATRESTDTNRVNASLQSDAAMPQPKSAAITASQEPAVAKTADVTTALKTFGSSPADVTTTNLSTEQETRVTPITDLAAKTPGSSTAAESLAGRSGEAT